MSLKYSMNSLFVMLSAILIPGIILAVDTPQTAQTQTIPSQTPEMKDTSFLLRTVALLSTPRPDGKRDIGTAFLVRVKKLLFLVTAEHVSAKTTAETKIVLSAKDDRPESFPLSSWAHAGRVKWVSHDVADVAILEIDPQEEIRADVVDRAVNVEEYMLGSFVSPERDRPTLTIGFPRGLGIDILGPDARVSPISRESKPVSGLLTLPRFDNKRNEIFFLLENPSLGGFSGSPVYVFPGTWSKGAGFGVYRSTACIGLIHGTLYDVEREGREGEGRFAAVVPSQYIVETLQKALDQR